MRRLVLPTLVGAALSLGLVQWPGLAPEAGAATWLQEWEDPTEEQIKEMTSSDFWFWVNQCTAHNRKDTLTMLTKTLWEDKERKEYIDQVWSAIYTRMTTAEGELKADASNTDAKNRMAQEMGRLRFWAPCITEATGNSGRQDQIEEYAKLDPKTREQKSWAIGRYHSAEHAIEFEKDYNSALARLEAGWTIIETLKDKYWMHKFLSLMAECYEHLKKTADAFEKLTAAKKFAEENGDAEDAKAYEEKLAHLKESGGPIKKSALDLPESWAKEWTTHKLAPGGGMGAKALPVRTPSPYLRSNPFFWSRLYLADDRKGNIGGVIRAEKLPIPGDQWIVKTEGDHEATLTADPQKKGSKFKADARGTMQQVLATYAPIKTGGRPVQLPYFFMAANPNEVRIYNQKLVVNNPKNILDLRIRPMTWRSGKGPEGQKVTIIDGNFNGQFGTIWKSAQGKQFEDVGLDGFHAGRGKVGNFFSSFQQIGKGFYRIEPHKSSLGFDANKFTGPTGKVKVNVALGKAKPTWLIVSMPYTFRRGNKEENTEALINIADAAGKEMELPTGGWKLYYGLFADGSNEDKSGRIEMRPGNSKSFEITEGTTTEINIGGTITPVVPAAYDEGKNEVLIDTEKIEFHGEHGEVYHHVWPHIFQYQATAMDERGPVTKAEKARAYTEQEVKPSHDALAFAKKIETKALRKPQGKLWVKISGAHKMLGKLSCNADPTGGE
ncbi:MAG: hypothetical protein ACYTGX_08720 [Planctomycetota bacterium]|jgi:hypothetical protein